MIFEPCYNICPLKCWSFSSSCLKGHSHLLLFSLFLEVFVGLSAPEISVTFIPHNFSESPETQISGFNCELMRLINIISSWESAE